MSILFCMRLTISAMVIAVPLLAHAQSATSFDGTYNGVSIQVTAGRCVAAGTAPAKLVISNSAAQFKAGMSGDITYQGTVDAKGTLSMKASNGCNLGGKIDGAGRITAASNCGSPCTMAWVWQK